MKELNNIKMLRAIDDEVLKKFVNKGIEQKSFHKGATVHEQYKPCSGIDIVLDGKLAAYTLSPNGSETIVFEFEREDIIGANLLFGNQNQYPMNIYCVADCTMVHIGKETISELLKNYDFAMDFIHSISMNSQGMNHKIAMYTQKSLRENIIGYLQALAKEQASSAVVLPISKKQLADYFGVQRPSLFRELKKMKDEGLIEVYNKRIEISALLED